MFGRGNGGGRGGGGRGRGLGRRRSGPRRECICPKCKTVIPHQRGVPCFQMTCPNCGSQMMGRFMNQ